MSKELASLKAAAAERLRVIVEEALQRWATKKLSEFSVAPASSFVVAAMLESGFVKYDRRDHKELLAMTPTRERVWMHDGEWKKDRREKSR